MGRRGTSCNTAMRSSQRKRCTLHPLPWRSQQRSWRLRKRMTAHHYNAPSSKWCVGSQLLFVAHAYMCMCKHVPGRCLVHARWKNVATQSQRWASLLSCEAAMCLFWRCCLLVMLQMLTAMTKQVRGETAKEIKGARIKYYGHLKKEEMEAMLVGERVCPDHCKSSLL
jgi:hypothetical protein